MNMLLQLVVVVAVVCSAATATEHNNTINCVFMGNNDLMVYEDKVTENVREGRLHTLGRHPASAVCEYVHFPALSSHVLVKDAVFQSSHVIGDNKIEFDSAFIGDGASIVWNVRTGQYVIRRCEAEGMFRSQLNPCPVYASAVQPILTTSKLFFAGPQRVLAYDPSGDFKMLLFDTDVHGAGMPFRVLFEGQFNFTGQAEFVLVSSSGTDQLVVHLPEQGTLVVWDYNARAERAEEMVSGIAGEGFTSKASTTIPVGGPDLLVYNKITAFYEVWRISRQQQQVSWEVIASGNLKSGHNCEEAKTHTDCVSRDGCGWCLAKGGCHEMANQTTFCDGLSCPDTPSQYLGKTGYKDKKFRPIPMEGSIDQVVPSMSPTERELAMRLPDYDLRSVDRIFESEEATIAWAGSLDEIEIRPNLERIQTFFVPPQTKSEPCMNVQQPPSANSASPDVVPATDESKQQHELRDTNCTRVSARPRAPFALTPSSLQPPISKFTKPETLEKEKLTNTNFHMLTMRKDFMNNHTKNQLNGKVYVDEVARLESEHMERGSGSIVEYGGLGSYEHKSGGENFAVFHSAMNSAVDAVVDDEGEIKPRVSTSAIPSPTPSYQTTPTATPSTSPSLTASPSVTPTMRPWPCIENVIVKDGIIICGPCDSYVFSPNDIETHLMKLPEPSWCATAASQEQQLLVQEGDNNDNNNKGVPEIPEEIIRLSRAVDPIPENANADGDHEIDWQLPQTN